MKLNDMRRMLVNVQTSPLNHLFFVHGSELATLEYE